MTEQDQLRKPLPPAPLGQHALQGSSLALLLVIIFLLPGGEPNAGAPKFWWLLPVTLAPAAGALGGAFYYMLALFCYKGGWNTTFPNILSLLVYILLVAISFALSMNGPD
ncbi:ABC-type uncharacterized transport system YnjBCD permease subunit [Pontibacter aydingkolensis]|uniref:Uncharacterized protein n=1 Tax=Pontibacter aydingkolensis TaxID=1911536 RepID=A0ABS7CW31_9BACT|nr:hypothetical protein [Pontibacter aydingkolensis]MBW7468064.1 hypothetical protein [Pontibacter aydingkolensis]